MAAEIIHIEFKSANFARTSEFYAKVFDWQMEQNASASYMKLSGTGGPSGGWVRADLVQSPGPDRLPARRRSGGDAERGRGRPAAGSWSAACRSRAAARLGSSPIPTATCSASGSARRAARRPRPPSPRPSRRFRHRHRPRAQAGQTGRQAPRGEEARQEEVANRVGAVGLCPTEPVAEGAGTLPRFPHLLQPPPEGVGQALDAGAPTSLASRTRQRVSSSLAAMSEISIVPTSAAPAGSITLTTSSRL